MRQAYKAGAAPAAPAASQATSVGFATEGDGTPGSATVPGPFWFHAISTEAENLIRAGGLTPETGTLTQVRDAVRAIVAAAIDDLIDSSPGALDTLNELAAAINDDPSFAATVNAAIAARLTQAQGDARYLRSIPDEYLTEAEGDARYIRSGLLATELFFSADGLSVTDASAGTSIAISDLPSYRYLDIAYGHYRQRTIGNVIDVDVGGNRFARLSMSVIGELQNHRSRLEFGAAADLPAGQIRVWRDAAGLRLRRVDAMGNSPPPTASPVVYSIFGWSV